MGITGLLPYLSGATRHCHISEFRGGTVAVDSYCLLHKGTSTCAEQLARGEDNQRYVDYCLKYVKMLLSYDIHPIMVFDGRNLPAKAETEAKRRESRKKAKQKGVELLKLGKAEEARVYLKQCVDVTPKMAHNLIEECHKLNVDCIVAPYESDAQLAFFNIKKVAQCVITEDSDLILFGCKQVLYKLDLSGAGRLVESDKICAAMEMQPNQFSFEKFRYMCILSGCDYASSLNGIGLKKAEKFLKLTAETNPEIFLDRIPRYLNMKHLKVTGEYKKKVLIANATFLHQIVFDPYKKKLVHLTEPEICGTNPDYLVSAGDIFDHEKALEVALGNLNPYNFEKLDDWSPSNLPPYSIWSGIYKRRVSRKEEQELQKNKLHTFIKQAEIKSRAIDESIKYEEEAEIEKELSKYTKVLEIKEVKVEEEIIDPEVTEKNKSPPLSSKNPFAKKKISSFPRTFIQGRSIVRSRFFCSEPASASSSNILLDSPKPKFDSTDNEDEADNTIEEDKPNVPHESENTVLKSCENTCKTVWAKRSSEQMSESDIEVEAYVKNVGVDLVQEETFHKKEPIQNEAKKRKLGRGRNIGLRKPVRQITLHNFFDKLMK